MTKKLYVGVLGLGMGANILTLNSDPESELEVTTICDLNEEKLEQYKKQFSIEKAYSQYEKMLEDTGIDIVAVYTPDALHKDHCVKALEAGKHVVCTKPMATNNDDAQEIVDAVNSSGKKLMVAQTARFVKQYQHMKSIIESGELGSIVACRSQYVHDISPYLKLTPWRLEMPQDFMYGGGLHPIDLLRWLLGDITEVYAYAQKSGRESDYPMEDNFMLIMKFEKDCIGTVSILCGVYHPPIPIIEVDLFGSVGSVMATYTEGEPGVLQLVTERLADAPVQRIEYTAETGVTYKHGESERSIFKYFAECLFNNREPDPNVVEGAKGVAVAYAAWDSIRTGRPTKVKKDF